jgi:hypothetical protein
MRGNQLAIWVDQHDFSAATSQIDLTFEVGEGERTSLASDAQEFLPLLPKISVQQNGYFEGVLPAGFAAELQARFAQRNAILTVLVDRSDPACIAYVLPDATGMEMAFAAPANNLTTLNGKWGTSANAVRGRRIFDGTLTATGEQPSIDLGAGTLDRGLAVVHVASITGAALNAELTVESSADNLTFTDEGAITLSAPGAYTLSLTGAVSRYLRLNCTDLGGATAIRCLAIVSLA